MVLKKQRRAIASKNLMKSNIARKFFRRLFPVKTSSDTPVTYIANKFFVDRVNDEPVLIVGDYTNREYDSLSAKFREVYSLDIIDNPRIPKDFYVKQSIEDRLPFPDGFFKFIVLGEVIEHVWRDRDALLELNRVLAEKGKLLLSVQFYRDNRYHYHIYSPQSILWLLEHSNFEPAETKYQGLVTLIFGARFTGILAVILYPFWGQKALRAANHCVWLLFDFMSNSWSLNRWFFPSAFITAVKFPHNINPVEKQALVGAGRIIVQRQEKK